MAKVLIHSYALIGTRLVIHEVWEPATLTSHSAIRHVDGRLYGKLDSRRLPRSLEDLPARSDERVRQVEAWQTFVDRLARSVLVAAMPFLREDGQWRAGAMTELAANARFAKALNKTWEFDFRGPILQPVEVRCDH